MVTESHHSLIISGVGTSLLVQWLGLCASNLGGLGSITSHGTKIPHACGTIKNLFLLLLFRLCWVFLAVQACLSLWLLRGTLQLDVRVSLCGGFFCCRAEALDHRLESWGTRAQLLCSMQDYPDIIRNGDVRIYRVDDYFGSTCVCVARGTPRKEWAVGN